LPAVGASPRREHGRVTPTAPGDHTPKGPDLHGPRAHASPPSSPHDIAAFRAGIAGTVIGPDDEEAYYEALRPGARGVYANFLEDEDEGEARVREAYPDLTYHRLAQTKATYDPTNLFHLNQSIRPAGES